MKVFTEKYLLFRHLSLDVVLGAIASGSMVVWLVGKEMPWVWWVALPMAVWVVYTSDHLLDAYRLQDRANTPRHLFHHIYFSPLATVWLILLLSCLTWVPYFAPKNLILMGLGMGGLAAIHLGLVVWVGKRISQFFFKEAGVGLVYALGTWGGPFILYPELITPSAIFCLIQFFLLAMINLLFFSMYEAETDKRDGHTSIVLAIGQKRTQRWIIGFAVVIILLGVIILTQTSETKLFIIQGIFLLMLLALLLIAFHAAWFRENERYRSWGDGVFLLPALVWLV